MAASNVITLDTTAPPNVQVIINNGDAAATEQAVSVAITTDDTPTTGYLVKIWGDVDGGANPSIQPLEANSAWISLASPHAVSLSAGDGVKTINVKMDDGLGNISGTAFDTITLDSTAPVVTMGVPSPSRISKIAGKDTSTFNWSVDVPFEEFKIKVVSAAGDLHTTGTQIPTTNGSTDMSGALGGYPAATNRTASVRGADLEAAAAGDGDKIVKVFVRDAAGNWSV